MSCPVLVLGGRKRRIVDKDYGRRYDGSIPGARSGIIPEAGRFPQVERPDKVVRYSKFWPLGLLLS